MKTLTTFKLEFKQNEEGMKEELPTPIQLPMIIGISPENTPE